VTRFVREKRFEGGGGLEITEEMKVIVAAQACLLILNLDAGCYPRVRSVVMYPGTFVPRLPTLDRQLHAGPMAQPAPLLGEHVRGVVVLSWKVPGDPTGSRDGQNVVLHEFAHELDREDGYVDGSRCSRRRPQRRCGRVCCSTGSRSWGSRHSRASRGC
jgi:Mlc titration factor MtfA (ptsG expression regulator)